MNKSNLHVSGCGFLILLVLLWCAPAMAQRTEGLGGSLNDAASEKITRAIHRSCGAAPPGEETGREDQRSTICGSVG